MPYVRMIRCILFSIGCLLFCHSIPASAQTDDIRIYVDLAVRQNYISEPDRVLQPTLQLDKKLGVIDTAQVVVRGGFYWGYWQDGITEVIDCPHCYTYAHRSHVLGARLIVHGVRQIIPLQIMTGVSRQFINNIYIGGFGNNGEIGEDYRNGFWQIDTGAKLQFKLSRLLVFSGGVEAQIPVWVGENSVHQMNILYSLGFGYQFGTVGK